MKKVINTICVILGFVFAGMGLLGVVLPVLPTTPFFLAAACLFAKGSERFHRWFVETMLYKKYIVQAVHKKEMTGKAKLKMMSVLGILFTVGFFFSPIWHAKLLIAVVAMGHFYYFLFKIKTVKVAEVVVSEE